MAKTYAKSDAKTKRLTSRPTSDAEVGRFADRLRAAIGDQSVRQVAQRAQVSDTVVRNYLSGQTEPTRPIILALGEALGVSAAWLLAGEGPMKRGEGETGRGEGRSADGQADYRPQRRDEDEFVAIPVYEPAVSAGPGAEVLGERATDWLHFKRAWIRTELHTTPASLSLLYIVGSSMEPTLANGDVILVERGPKVGLRDGIYVIRMETALVVKRVEFRPGGKALCKSDNPENEPYPIDLADPTIEIVGRVVWAGRRM